MDNSILHIILADDDESDRTNFREALEESKIKTTVYAVKDGVETDHVPARCRGRTQSVLVPRPVDNRARGCALDARLDRAPPGRCVGGNEAGCRLGEQGRCDQQARCEQQEQDS